eukprot:gene4134-753_t
MPLRRGRRLLAAAAESEETSAEPKRPKFTRWAWVNGLHHQLRSDDEEWSICGVRTTSAKTMSEVFATDKCPRCVAPTPGLASIELSAPARDKATIPQGGAPAEANSPADLDVPQLQAFVGCSTYSPSKVLADISCALGLALCITPILQVYTHLWKLYSGLSNKDGKAVTLPPSKALDALNKYFPGASHVNISLRPAVRQAKKAIVVLDEVDQLIGDPSVMYNLFEWASHKDSRTGLIVIANTIDLPANVSSRYRSQIPGASAYALRYKPYSSTELAAIAAGRLQTDWYAADALQLAAQKVAGDSGDARQMLELLSRVVDVAEREFMYSHSESTSIIKLEWRHVEEAIRESFVELKGPLVDSLPFYHKAALMCIASRYAKLETHDPGHVTPNVCLLDAHNLLLATLDLMQKEYGNAPPVVPLLFQDTCAFTSALGAAHLVQ